MQQDDTTSTRSFSKWPIRIILMLSAMAGCFLMFRIVYQEMTTPPKYTLVAKKQLNALPQCEKVWVAQEIKKTHHPLTESQLHILNQKYRAEVHARTVK